MNTGANIENGSMQRLPMKATSILFLLTLVTCTTIAADEDKVVEEDKVQLKVVAILRGHRDSIYSLALSPDGNVLASGSGESESFGFAFRGHIILWDMKTKQQIVKEKVLKSPVLRIHYSPDGSLIAASSSYKIRILRSKDLSKVAEIKMGSDRKMPRLLQMISNTDILIYEDGDLLTMDYKTMKKRVLIQDVGETQRVILSANGRVNFVID